MPPSAASPTKRPLSESSLDPEEFPSKKRRTAAVFELPSSDSDDDEMNWNQENQDPGDWAGMEAMTITQTNLDRMPPSVIARIASHVMDIGLEKIEEVRACNCLGPVYKPFPYRCGDTSFVKDPDTKSDIRRDVGKCRLDSRGGFGGGWCLKQYIARAPGKKRQIPAFAVCNKTLYKKWRHATAWVFCSEACMHLLIPGLPKYNKRLITRARFYERNNDIDIDGLSQESYARGSYGGWDDFLVYETHGNQFVDYRDVKIWVKELVLPGNEF